jgi:chemotaxis protein histidine kinase CheA
MFPDLHRPAPKVASSNVVRVDLVRLDELIRIVGEMVTSRARMKIR